MFTYFKMKKNENRIKAMFYGMIVGFMDNQKEIIEIMQKMYAALKDIPADKFRDEFLSKLAEIATEHPAKEE